MSITSVLFSAEKKMTNNFGHALSRIPNDTNCFDCLTQRISGIGIKKVLIDESRSKFCFISC